MRGCIPEEKRHSKKAERAKSASCRMPSPVALLPGMPALRSVIPGYYKSASSGCHSLPVEVRLSETHVSVPIRLLPSVAPPFARAPRRGAPPPPTAICAHRCPGASERRTSTPPDGMGIFCMCGRDLSRPYRRLAFAERRRWPQRQKRHLRWRQYSLRRWMRAWPWNAFSAFMPA